MWNHDFLGETEETDMMNYEPPYTYEELLKNYGKTTAERLSKDPVHA